MYLYLLKRVLFFIPTLLVISMFCFFLSVLAPGDQTNQLMQLGDAYLKEEQYVNEYKRIAHQTHADLPLFYFSILPSNIPKDLRQKYLIKDDRKVILNHLFEGRSFESVKHWEKAIDEQISANRINPDGQTNTRNLDRLYELKMIIDENQIREKLDNFKGEEFKQLDVIALNHSFDKLKNSKDSGFMIPAIYWYGTKNQFQFWLNGFFKPGSIVSLKDGRPVMQKIGSSLYWTLLMILSALLISLAIAVPMGVYSAYYPERWWSRRFEQISFALYSVPVFWLSAVLILLFATPYYGLKIFPSVGLFSANKAGGFVVNLFSSFHLLVLPIVVLSLHTLAFISRQVKLSMQRELEQAYFTTAIAKGLKVNTALWKHAFPNASLPLVTLITGSIPSLIAGTLLVEVIFNIPGMGWLMYDSILGKDWPVVFTVVNFSGLITVFSYLLADIAYMYIDPRIRLQL